MNYLSICVLPTHWSPGKSCAAWQHSSNDNFLKFSIMETQIELHLFFTKHETSSRGRETRCKTFDKLVAWQVAPHIKNVSISFMPTTGRGEWENEKWGWSIVCCPT